MYLCRYRIPIKTLCMYCSPSLRFILCNDYHTTWESYCHDDADEDDHHGGNWILCWFSILLPPIFDKARLIFKEEFGCTNSSDCGIITTSVKKLNGSKDPTVQDCCIDYLLLSSIQWQDTRHGRWPANKIHRIKTSSDRSFCPVRISNGASL